MTIHLIGSEGFIGKAIQKNSKNVTLHCWSHKHKEKSNRFNLFDKGSWENLLNSHPDTVLLVSWPDLPNYSNCFHIYRNLSLMVELVEALIKSGCKNIIVSGTCYEYGDIDGCLEEDIEVKPNNAYAIAKDALRRSIEFICEKNSVRWVWARIFYPYGEDQNQNSLYPSLLRAIKKNDQEFNISSGNQKRDFISSDQVALNLLFLCTNFKAKGIFNCGSGVPTSIIEFVKKIIKKKGSSIIIRTGVCFDRFGEPEAFWANMKKFNSLKG
tara:strand:+ start:1287 stop:2093 length:807 start_codon:yes stop_codon:yes gene_type:complete